MQLEPGQLITLIALAGSTGLTLVAVGVAWGTLKTKVDGINTRLDRMNGRQDRLEANHTNHLEGHHSYGHIGD